MDAPTAIMLDGKQLLDAAQGVLWVFLRVGSALVAAPLVGGHGVPRRTRLVLALGISLAIASLWPHPQVPEVFSSAWLALVARELLLGLAIGFTLHIGFEALAFASELMAQGMGLSFAQMVNPLTGSAGALLNQLMIVVAGLLFFTADLHLVLIEFLARSLETIPPHRPFNALGVVPVLLELMGQALLVGVRIALPLMTAMFLVNLVFGVLSRTAPVLNPLAVGFPATLLGGLLLLMVLLPRFTPPFLDFIRDAFGALTAWAR